ncbi:helix-turn-helix domain-containing protein [Pseudoflavonifractor phocaeensis]|uniref:helix-turn-helix domain-containing protein n=1 Tax=Pseudoflavonifractor phocaeensis TaxID=1870988 RepID=UPI001956D9AD|nr:helix-turn-helix transcriptional regulator [Pseudoflavonifractor phocaeensis]MBM6870929.1 helix-turn-helix transcriptional regulator [Pseudoflavonifractor phocaeensis]
MRNEILRFERIRNLRIDHNLSQQKIAELLNVKQNTYSQYEIGVLNYPVDVLIKLAAFYDTSVDYLLGLTDERKPYPRRKN